MCSVKIANLFPFIVNLTYIKQEFKLTAYIQSPARTRTGLQVGDVGAAGQQVN